jgi:hypothetical protein
MGLPDEHPRMALADAENMNSGAPTLPLLGQTRDANELRQHSWGQRRAFWVFD